MGTFSFWHILIILMLFMVLFGRGKISDLMGDVAKGIKSFKKGMADDEPSPPSPPPMVNAPRTIDAKIDSPAKHDEPAPQPRTIPQAEPAAPHKVEEPAKQ